MAGHRRRRVCVWWLLMGGTLTVGLLPFGGLGEYASCVLVGKLASLGVGVVEHTVGS